LIDAQFILLGGLASVRAGHPFRGAIESVSDGGVIALQMKDVDPEHGIGWAGAIRTFLEGRKQPEWLQAGDLLLVARGVSFYAVLVTQPPGPAVCGPAFFHLRVHPGRPADPAFLAWQINQPPFQRQLLQSAEGSGQLSVRRPVLETLPLALPSLADQRRIAALDAAARAERIALRQLIRNREQQLHALAESLSVASGANPQ
jgi:hypothetical protein